MESVLSEFADFSQHWLVDELDAATVNDDYFFIYKTCKRPDGVGCRHVG